MAIIKFKVPIVSNKTKQKYVNNEMSYKNTIPMCQTRANNNSITIYYNYYEYKYIS